MVLSVEFVHDQMFVQLLAKFVLRLWGFVQRFVGCGTFNQEIYDLNSNVLFNDHFGQKEY